jgi:hypothetical protein
MEDIGTFYGHLVQFTVFCYIFLTFVKVRGNWAYFIPFWYFVPRKIWQPWGRERKKIPVRISITVRFDRLTFLSVNKTGFQNDLMIFFASEN